MIVEINIDDPVVRGLLFYVSLLVVKIFLVTLLTIHNRWNKKIPVLISPEDAQFANNALKIPEAVIKTDDEDVERVRRAHLNDLENIPMFIFTAFIYVLTKPSPSIALNLFRVFTAARFLHTIVYALVVIPQPARAILFAVGFVINWYMLFVTLTTFVYF